MTFNKIKKLFIVISCPIFLRALFKGVAAGTEHISVLKTLNCNYIIDVGANRGQFALVARKLFPNVYIHSFEPLEEPAKIFKCVFNDDDKAVLHHCAIGSENKMMTIHVSERDDSSSLLPIGDNQSKLFPHTGESEVRETSVVQLTNAINIDLISNHALLKIDVQGFELEVLKGCDSIIDKIQYVYVECSFIELYEGQAFAYEVINFLRDRSFNLLGIYNMSYDSRGKAIQADFLFEKTSKVF